MRRCWTLGCAWRLLLCSALVQEAEALAVRFETASSMLRENGSSVGSKARGGWAVANTRYLSGVARKLIWGW